MIHIDKDIYHQLAAEENLPIFFQPWYLDAVTKGYEWRPYIFMEEEVAKAVWITTYKVKAGVKMSLQPQLTAYTGYYSIEGQGHDEAFRALCSAVQKDLELIIQDFYPTVKPRKDKSTKKITYVIDDSQSSDAAFVNMKSDWRRKIRKAEKIHTVEPISYENFSKVLMTSFEQKNRPNPYPMDVFGTVEKAASQYDSRIILGAKDSSGKLVGAAYFLKDSQSYYYLAGGHTDSNNSMYLLLWQGIKFALDIGRSFDFEGSMIPGIAQFFRGFGGKEVHYHSFKYTKNSWVDFLLWTKKKLS